MEDKIGILLSDVEREFYRLPPYKRAKFAIEQISMWQQKFNEAKDKVVKENFKNFLDTTCEQSVC